ncbi:MAG: hypothetical protein AMJ54_07260 [Deltaproteobacteria bacterium SG8_13]|nr:MAG: hypothetical protein AMJ54_07260 [Deltaproteobacteria bacterium SG8_13]
MKFRNQSGLTVLAAVLLFFTLQPGCGAGEQPYTSVLEGVSFVDNAAGLAAGADSALEELLQELLADPSVSIEIRCTVASSGDENQDARLSRDRAQTLRRWLMNRGVAFFRLQIADLQTSTAADVSAVPAETREIEEERVEITRIRKSFPIADIPASAFRFEPVVDGQEVLHDFQLFNKGDAPLNISKVRTG